MLFTSAPRRRRSLALALTAGLVAAMVGLVASPAPAANTAPVRIEIDSVTSDVVAPGGLAPTAVPSVLVEARKAVYVTVSFYDASNAPAFFTKDTTLTIASNVGTLGRTTGTALKGYSSVTIDTSLTTAVNQVVLTVSAGTGPKALTEGVSYVKDAAGVVKKDLRFDVLSNLVLKSPKKGEAFSDGIGGDDGRCGNASSDLPVCGVLVLPHGASCVDTAGGDPCITAPVLLSTGACDVGYAKCRTSRPGVLPGAVIQVLFNDGGLYSKADPATLIIKCDKSLCGGGSIRDVPLNFTLGGNDPLGSAPKCPAKGTVGTDPDGTDQKACVDYVQSKRDGAGDTHLYLLFTRDMRGSVG